MSDPLLFDLADDGVATLTLNRPDRLNALDHALQLALRDALARVQADTRVRAVLLTGAGRAFCVGADLAAGMFPPDGQSPGNRSADGMIALANPLVQGLRELPVPVVSALNGPVAGGGLGFALAADVVLAARSAYFYLPFIPKLAIVPDLGASWFLQRLVGTGRASAMTLLDERLSAEKAEAWGLVWKCLDDEALMPEARATAAKLARLPAHAALETRRLYAAAETNTLAAQLRLEAERQRDLLDRPDCAEGIRAFLEKRAPAYAPRGGSPS